MASLMRMDALYNSALTCHPAIAAFLRGIADEGTVFKRFCNPAKLRQYCTSAVGDVFRVEVSWRSFADQQALYDKSRSAPSKDYGKHVTFARGGDSFHNWGLAVDVVFTRTGYDVGYYDKRYFGVNKLYEFYEATGLVDYAKACGLRWLGRDPQLMDIVHFECGTLPPVSLRIQAFAKPGWWETPSTASGESVEGSAADGKANPWLILLAAALGVYLVTRKKDEKLNWLVLAGAGAAGFVLLFPELVKSFLTWANRDVVPAGVWAGAPFGEGSVTGQEKNVDKDSWWNRSVVPGYD